MFSPQTPLSSFCIGQIFLSTLSSGFQARPGWGLGRGIKLDARLGGIYSGMTTLEIIERAEQLVRRDGALADTTDVLDLILALARRLAAIESREEVRHRAESIVRGEKPEPGVGR